MASSPYALPLHFLSVGDTILIYWDGDRKWYPAEVTGAAGDHGCEVLYRDGEREWVSLDKVKFIVRRDWDRSIRRRSKKAKSGDSSGEEADENQIEAVKNILFDLEDRLPHEGVYEENLDWWKVWHDGILLCVGKNDIQGLMDATLRLSMQLKPNITSKWWAKHGADWKKRLKNVVTTRDAALVVKELQNNAINWSTARKLFSEKEKTDWFEDSCFEDESKGRNRVDDPTSNESLGPSGQCLDVTISRSHSYMVPSMTGELPLQERTVLLTTDSDSESEIKVMYKKRSSPLHKTKPENENDTSPSPKGKTIDGFGRKKGSSFQTPRKGKMQKVVLRRSNRLKKSTLEITLSSKCADAKEDLLESPCLTVDAVRCSTESEIHGGLVSAPSSPNKVTRMKHSDRVACNRRNRGSSKCVNASQPKKNRSCISREVEYSEGITDLKDDPLDEGSVGDNMKTGDYTLADGILCSICQNGVGSNFLVQCKQSDCFCSFHSFCLTPPLQTIGEDWLCPYCDGGALSHKLTKEPIAKRVKSIVGHKRVFLEHQRNGFQDHFLIKWESLSHHHDSWVPLEWLYVIDRVRLHRYQKKFPITDGAYSIDLRKPEWFKIDRVIACRRKLNSDNSCEIWNLCKAKQDNGEFEFLVKWIGLDYCDATWESSCTEELLAEVGRLVQRHERAAERAENYSPVSSTSELDKTPDNLYGGILYDYQLQGLRWILSNFMARRNIILADEMGLGKTVQVVSFVNCMKQAKLNANPVLIIAPKSILFQWEKEFRHWTKELNVIIYQGEKQSRRCIRTHEMYSSEKRVLFDALISNYELVILDNSVLKKIKWSAIIIDEAHKVKRLDCKLASCLKRYTSDFRLLLTGTPLQNTLLELFSLLHFIDPEQFSDPKAEAEAFSSIKPGLRHSEVEMKIAQIHELLRPRMLRRMKSDVLPGSIPVKKWVEVPCALTESQRELYIDILEKNYKKLNKGIQSGKKIILNFILMELKKCCNHPYLFPGQEIYISSREAAFVSLVASSGKLQLLEKLLPKLKERGNRVLLFSQMTKMLDILEDFLLFLGLAYFRIDGQTSIAARQQQMKEFNSPESDVFLFLISTRAGGLGLDLPTADRVIIYDPDFNPFMDLQAQSRAHRIGQIRPVMVYQLITKLSVEEKILRKSKEKLAIENLVMNPSKKPTVDELHSVLLHGARTILNRKNVHATLVHYDDVAIETLLKLDPLPGEKCSPDDNAYLGSIQSFVPGTAEGEERPPSPKGVEWKEILGPVSAETMAGGFGRGKRQKKEVKYQCEDESNSDEIYSPGDSSTDPSNDDDDSESEPSYERDDYEI